MKMMDKDLTENIISEKEQTSGSIIDGILNIVGNNLIDNLISSNSNIEIEQINSPIDYPDINSEHDNLVGIEDNKDDLESPVGIRISNSNNEDTLQTIDSDDENYPDEDNIQINRREARQKYVPRQYVPRYTGRRDNSKQEKYGMTRNSMINKLNVLRISHPEFVTEEYTKFDDESLRDYLDDIVPNIHIAEEVAKSMSYMILGYIAVEIFGVYYLKMDVFDGFFKYNAGKIKSMRFSFLEMAEESYMNSEQGSNPLWMMAFTAVFNIIVFFVISIVNKMYGSDISPVIEKSIEGLVGGDKNDKTLDIVSGIMNIASKFVRK